MKFLFATALAVCLAVAVQGERVRKSIPLTGFELLARTVQGNIGVSILEPTSEPFNLQVTVDNGQVTRIENVEEFVQYMSTNAVFKTNGLTLVNQLISALFGNTDKPLEAAPVKSTKEQQASSPVPSNELIKEIEPVEYENAKSEMAFPTYVPQPPGEEESNSQVSQEIVEPLDAAIINAALNRIADAIRSAGGVNSLAHRTSKNYSKSDAE